MGRAMAEALYSAEKQIYGRRCAGEKEPSALHIWLMMRKKKCTVAVKVYPDGDFSEESSVLKKSGRIFRE